MISVWDDKRGNKGERCLWPFRGKSGILNSGKDDNLNDKGERRLWPFSVLFWENVFWSCDVIIVSYGFVWTFTRLCNRNCD